ncbi:pyridoxamine 5'-phosphate oxidase family protein [Diaminobutyricibacter sp. McL0608]|uniref:pyridoxamine 5'-phosphate oxidase family protein n=1 Tax=Leifsonia sp. McL0608 TaxID=3143537 RepID=UPI0031F2E23C
MNTSASVTELSEDECWTKLSGNSLGRLATSVGSEVDIFPVNYLADGKTLLIRTAPGTKLLELTIHHDIAFEVDGYTDTEAWSVIVKGVATELESQTEIDEANRQPLAPWIPTLKYRYVRITPLSITGRHFRREPEPERY